MNLRITWRRGLIFGSLSRQRRIGTALSAMPEFEDTIEQKPIVDVGCETFESKSDHQIVDDERDLNVGGVRDGADSVEIALPEFAITPLSGVLAAQTGPM